MDELVQYLVEELAFSGPLGASELELTKLIGDYYEQHADVQQNVDSAFVHLVLESLLDLEEICMGTVDEKAGKLAPLNKTFEGNVLSPKELIDKFKDRVHFAVNEDTCWLALTGSHSRPTKLTPKVYAALSLVGHGRTEGATTLDIGRHLGCDQKSAYHYVKSLLGLDLVVKIRTIDKGSTTSRIIHKRYLSQSKAWQDHTAKDPTAAVAAAASEIKEEPDFEATPSLLDNEHADLENQHKFSPIGVAHLTSNVPLVRSRIIKVLRSLPLNAIPTAQLITSINLQPVIKHTRRVLNRFMHVMRDEGIIEHVVLTPDYENARAGRLHCWQLTKEGQEFDLRQPSGPQDLAQQNTTVSSQSDSYDPLWIVDEEERLNRMLYTVPLLRQIIDLVFGSAERGLIQREIWGALRPAPGRAVEQTLFHYENAILPPHLSDFGIEFVRETYGRERRLRFFSIAGYAQRCVDDGLEVPQEIVARVDETRAGTWALTDEGVDDNFDSIEALDQHLRTLPERMHTTVKTSKSGRAKDPNKPARIGRPPKDPNAPKMKYTRKTKEDGTLVKPHPGMSNDKPWDASKKSSKPYKYRGKATDTDNVQPQAATIPDETSSQKPSRKRTKVAADPKPKVPVPTTTVETTSPSAPTESRSATTSDNLARVEVEGLQLSANNSLFALPPIGGKENSAPKSSEMRLDDASKATEPQDLHSLATSTTNQTPAEGPSLELGVTEQKPRRKLAKTTSATRSNHTIRMRETEMMETLISAGGVLEDAQSLTREHQSWIRKSLKKGPDEVVPMCDRRTLIQAVNNLEHRGEVKRLIAEVTGKSGVPRQVRLIHLPHLNTSSPEMVQFLNTLKTAPSVPLRRTLIEGDTASAVASAFRTAYKRSHADSSSYDLPLLNPTSKKRRKLDSEPDPAAEEKERQRQQKAAEKIAAKAQRMFQRKEADWKKALERFRTENNVDIIEEDIALFNLKRAFIGPGSISPQTFESEMHMLVQRQIERAEAAERIQVRKPSFSRPERQRSRVPAVPQSEMSALPGVQPAPATISTNESGGIRKRARWTIEEDDLLRDFWVIMTVRGELLNKSIPWKEAHDKLIPNHSPNQCRMHWLNVIYKPETQVYLNALVQSWRAVWLVRRGFGPLAEFDDRSMTGIDIRAQIRELRHTVHASVAHLGGLGLMPRNLSVVDLPDDPSMIAFEHDISSRERWTDGPDRWELATPSIAARAKDLSFLSASFGILELYPPQAETSQELRLAAACIKSLTATPSEDYIIDHGSRMLSRFKESLLTQAIFFLQKSGVIIKIDSIVNRRLPGRNYIFSERFENALRKQLPSATWKDAAAAAISLASEAEQILPLTPENGEMMAFLDHISKNLVDASLDLSLNQSKRDITDYQTRKLDDESIENTLVITRVDSTSRPQSRSFTDILEACTEGISYTALSDDEIQTMLPQIVEEVHMKNPSMVKQTIKDVLDRLLTILVVHQYGGIGFNDALEFGPLDVLKEVIAAGTRRCGERKSLFAWVGFEQPRLILCTPPALEAWAVLAPAATPDQRPTYFVPRLWINIAGRPIEMQLERASRAVLGLIHLVPGLSEIDIHSRLQPAFDFAEVCSLLEILAEAGFVEKVFVGADSGSVVSPWTKGYWHMRQDVCWYMF